MKFVAAYNVIFPLRFSTVFPGNMSLSIGSELPLFDAVTEWLPANGADMIRPRMPAVVQFWAVSCPICKMNVPHLLGLLENHASDGLQLISVHMPRMASDRDVEKVRRAVAELQLTGPCAIDNAHVIGERFQTGSVWPCYFLFDAEGKLRSRAAGALGLKIAENSLRRMLNKQEGQPTPKLESAV